MATEHPEAIMPSQPQAALAFYRRPIFIAILMAGLGLLLIVLPGGARSALLATVRTQWLLASLLLLFTLIAVSLVWTAGERLDSSIFLFFNLHSYRGPWLDRIMWLATQMGHMVTALLLAGLFFLLRLRGLSVMIILGTLTLWLAVELIKSVTDRTRPYLAVKGARVIGWREPGHSFPSGHTSQSFFLATYLLLTPLNEHLFQFGLAGAVGLYTIAAFVGFTRVYVGAHYPRDVIGGALMGSIWGILATFVDPYWLGVRLLGLGSG